jgi:hypothetical protein
MSLEKNVPNPIEIQTILNTLLEEPYASKYTLIH